MSLVIRPIERKDREQWENLWSNPEESYLKFYDSVDKVSKEDTDYTFNRFFDDEEPVYSAVAEYEGQVIGFVNYLTHAHTWTKSSVIYINDIYVSPKSRLSGTGRKLIEFVYDHADKLGCYKVYWHTAPDNHRAQLLYTKVANLTRVVYQRK